MRLSLEDALIRWSCVTNERSAFAAGYTTELAPFLAGWFMRDMEAKEPARSNLGTFASSFYAGWKEADMAIRIKMREIPHAFAVTPGGGPECCICGLSRREERAHQ